MRRAKLTDARKAAGKSQGKVADEVGVDRTTVGAWERGEATPHDRQRGAYAEALCITLTELHSILSYLPPPDKATPMWLSQYLALEQSATEKNTHVSHVINGLFQTPAYVAAVAESVGIGQTPASYVQRMVEQRAWRQERVNNGSLRLIAINSEMALRLKMGDNVIMADQLDHMVELGQLPNVTIQIVPFSVGQYEALRMAGHLFIMRHPWVEGVSVCFERYGSSNLIEDVDEAAHFLAAFDQAQDLALSPDDSLAFIGEIADEWRHK